MKMSKRSGLGSAPAPGGPSVELQAWLLPPSRGSSSFWGGGELLPAVSPHPAVFLTKLVRSWPVVSLLIVVKACMIKLELLPFLQTLVLPLPLDGPGIGSRQPCFPSSLTQAPAPFIAPQGVVQVPPPMYLCFAPVWQVKHLLWILVSPL